MKIKISKLGVKELEGKRRVFNVNKDLQKLSDLDIYFLPYDKYALLNKEVKDEFEQLKQEFLQGRISLVALLQELFRILIDTNLEQDIKEEEMKMILEEINLFIGYDDFSNFIQPYNTFHDE